MPSADSQQQSQTTNLTNDDIVFIEMSGGLPLKDTSVVDESDSLSCAATTAENNDAPIEPPQLLPDDTKDNRALVPALLAVNMGSVFAVAQVWFGYKDSFSINDKILIYAIVCSAVAASLSCIVARRLLRNPPPPAAAAAAGKWVFRAAIVFTSWDIIGWVCIFLPGVAKLAVMGVVVLLCSHAMFKLWS